LGYLREGRLWLVPYVPHEAAFGTISVLVPLYVITDLKQSMIFLGVLEAAWGASIILGSLLSGYVCDRLARYRLLVFVSFAGSGLATIGLTIFHDSLAFLLLYSVQALFYSAFRPPSNVLVTEWNPPDEWGWVMSVYTSVRAISWAGGLLIGAFLTPFLEFGGIFLLCAGLSLLASPLSLIFLQDPPSFLDRRLASLERAVTRAEYAVELLPLIHSPSLSRFARNELVQIGKTGFGRFLLGALSFSLATSFLFTQMPVFLRGAFLNPTLVFALFFSGTMASALIRPVAGAWGLSGVRIIRMSCVFRCLLAILIVPAAALSYPSSLYACFAIFGALGGMYALFDVASNLLSVELSPEGKVGYFFAFFGIGEIVGAFLSGVVSTLYGFSVTLALSGLMFAVALVMFWMVPEP